MLVYYWGLWLTPPPPRLFPRGPGCVWVWCFPRASQTNVSSFFFLRFFSFLDVDGWKPSGLFGKSIAETASTRLPCPGLALVFTSLVMVKEFVTTLPLYHLCVNPLPSGQRMMISLRPHFFLVREHVLTPFHDFSVSFFSFSTNLTSPEFFFFLCFFCSFGSRKELLPLFFSVGSALNTSVTPFLFRFAVPFLLFDPGITTPSSPENLWVPSHLVVFCASPTPFCRHALYNIGFHEFNSVNSCVCFFFLPVPPWPGRLHRRFGSFFRLFVGFPSIPALSLLLFLELSPAPRPFLSGDCFAFLHSQPQKFFSLSSGCFR